MDFKVKVMTVNMKKVKLTIWDTGDTMPLAAVPRASPAALLPDS